MTSIEIRRVGPDDAALFDQVAEDLFDNAVQPAGRDAFLADPNHLMVCAVDAAAPGPVMMGFVSAVVLFHPDKQPQLFLNEVSVAPPWRQRGVARRMIEAMLAWGDERGCSEAWVGTETDNDPANALYVATGGRADGPFMLYTYPRSTSRG